jgi:hypothetical protein
VAVDEIAGPAEAPCHLGGVDQPAASRLLGSVGDDGGDTPGDPLDRRLIERDAEWIGELPPPRRVFVNGGGRRQTLRNVEARIKTAIKAANRRLERLGIEPISERVTPYSLRRTYCSMRFGLGDDPVYVSEQMGHEDPAFSMRVYAKAIRRRARLAGSYLAEFDRALEWAGMGGESDSAATLDPIAVEAAEPEMASSSRNRGVSPDSSVG